MGKWIIPFATRSEQKMQVEVSGLSGNNNITLDGGPSPIVISEDNEEYAFHPVRLQSGNLKIVIDSTVDWRSMLPTSATDRPVVLRRTSGTYSEVLWIGYIQPDAYDMEMMSPMQEISLPVFCRLSALEGQDISGQHGHIGNFAELLQDILTNTGYTDYYFTGINIVEWLSKKVNYSLFYEFDDDNKVYRPKKDKLEILQEICTFFGWSLRSQSERLYFLSDDAAYANTGLSYIDSQELYDIALGNTVTPTIVSYDSLNISTVQFADDDYELNLVSGKKKVTVESDISPIESALEISSSRLGEYGKNYPIKYKKIQIGSSFGDPTPLHIFKTEYNKTEGEVIQVDQKTYYKVTYDLDEVVLTAYNGQGLEKFAYTSPYGIDTYESWNLNTKHTINLNWQLEWAPDNLHARGSNQFPYFKISTKNHFSLNSGILAISSVMAFQWAGLYNDKIQLVELNPKGTMDISIVVGNKCYYPGDSSTAAGWHTFTQGAPMRFTIATGTDLPGSGDITGTGNIPSNRVITINSNNYVVKDKPEYDGYGVPVDTALAGPIEIYFWKLQLQNYNDENSKFYHANWVYFRDFAIDFHKNVNQAEFNDTDRNQYVVENSDAFTDEEDIETIFASDKNNKYGIGLIMNADGTYCSELSYDDGDGITQKHPEQVLAERVATFYSKAKRQIQMSIFRSQQLLPSTQLIEHDGTEYMQLSQEIDYQEEAITLNIIEK